MRADPEPVPAHVRAIDGFRGTSALLVAIFHCWMFTDPPLDRGPLRALLIAGGLGVDFFFVISGFVLFLPVVRRAGRFGSLASYALRRVARIAPAYYVAVLVQAALTPMLSELPSPFTSVGGLTVIGIHLLFLQHEVPRWLLRQVGFEARVMGFGVNDALWSLSIEAIFYVALPLVAAFYFRRRVLAFVIALVASLAWRWLAFHLPSLASTVGAANAVVGNAPRLLEQFPGYLAHFAFGMSAAHVYARAWRDEPGMIAGFLRRRSGIVQAFALALLVLSMIAYGLQPKGAAVSAYARYFVDLVPAFAFAALMTSTALASPRGQWPMANPFARWLGDVSYGAFLWHFPLILLFTHTLGVIAGRGNLSFVGLCAFVLPSAFFLGWLSRRFIEEPAIAWARGRA